MECFYDLFDNSELSIMYIETAKQPENVFPSIYLIIELYLICYRCEKTLAEQAPVVIIVFPLLSIAWFEDFRGVCYEKISSNFIKVGR